MPHVSHEIPATFQQTLGRLQLLKKHAFIPHGEGVLVLEAILDTVTAATASELEEYLNSD